MELDGEGGKEEEEEIRMEILTDLRCLGRTEEEESGGGGRGRTVKAMHG